jgi:amidase
MVGAATAVGMPDDAFAFLCEIADAEPAPDESSMMRAARIVASRHRTWLQHDEARQQLRARWAAWFEEADVLLAPSFATPALLHQHDGDPMTRTIDIDGKRRAYFQNGWSTAFGVVYLPGVSVPGPMTADGLPVGIQAIGPYLEDRTALAAASAIEERLGGFRPPPGFE